MVRPQTRSLKQQLRIRRARRRPVTTLTRNVRTGNRLENGIYRVRKVVACKNNTLFNVSATAGTTAMLFNNSGITTISTNTTPTVQFAGFSLGFTLLDIPEANAYKTLYDRWKLDRVTVKIYPLNTFSETSLNGGSPNGSLGGFLHTCKDYDDYAAITASDVGVDSMRDRSTYKMYTLGGKRPFKIDIKPRCAVASYQGTSALFTGYRNEAASWNDCLSPSDAIEHFGVKCMFEILNPDTSLHYMSFKVESTYHLTFKDPI